MVAYNWLRQERTKKQQNMPQESGEKGEKKCKSSWLMVTKAYNSEGAMISITEEQARRSLAQLQQNEYKEGELLADMLFHNLPGATVESLVEHLLEIWPDLHKYIAKLL